MLHPAREATLGYANGHVGSDSAQLGLEKDCNGSPMKLLVFYWTLDEWIDHNPSSNDREEHRISHSR